MIEGSIHQKDIITMIYALNFIVIAQYLVVYYNHEIMGVLKIFYSINMKCDRRRH